MKSQDKSALKLSVLPLLCFLLLLTACAETKELEWLTGEPVPEEVTNHYITNKPKSLGKTSWPRLADVPQEKPAFSTQHERTIKAKILVSEKLQADAAKEQIRAMDLYGDMSQPQTTQTYDEPFSFSALKP